MSLAVIPYDFSIHVDPSYCNPPSMHYHDTYELYYLDAGSREYFIEDKLFSVSAGNFVLIPPGKLHRTGGEYGLRTLINFRREFLETVYTKPMVDRMLSCFDRWWLNPDREQQAVCITYLKKMLSEKDGMENAITLGLLLLELSKCNSREFANDSVSAIVAYINVNYHRLHSIEEVAEAFFISKYHLCRIFKNAMKITVIEYLNQVKIKQACHLLINTKKDMTEIAKLCGFHSAAYFSKVFRKLMNQKPMEYRKNK